MSFCSSCGKDVPIGANFCPSCWNHLLPTQSVTTLDMSQEKVMSVLVLRPHPPSGQILLRLVETFNYLKLKRTNYPEALANVYQFVLVITNLRCIFAQLTSQMFAEELSRISQKTEKESKGFFGRSKASRSINFHEFVQKYSNMEPERILQETNGNYSIENSDIDSIEFTTTIWYQSFLGARS